MRAGSLERTVTIQRAANTVSAAGKVTTTWTDFATVRAELINSDHAETATAYGEQDTGRLALRIRYVSISTYDRITLAGDAFAITAVKEIGRRRGLELTCQRVTT